MITPGEITAGIASLRLAFDITKGLRDVANAADRNTKIVELQAAIMDAQAGAIEAQQAHSADVKRIGDLEAEVARLKAWEGEKQKYELKGLGGGAVAYMLKAEERGAEPPHWLCQPCYEKGQKRMLQPQDMVVVGRGHNFSCPECHSAFQTSAFQPNWS